jgi:hypothetical protein
VDVVLLREAEAELSALPSGERIAMLHVIEKLRVLRTLLAAPHSSQVKGTNLRELRPRAGRSRWRAFYRRIGAEMVIGAIGPEAIRDRLGFNRSVEAAATRLAGYDAERMR